MTRMYLHQIINVLSNSYHFKPFRCYSVSGNRIKMSYDDTQKQSNTREKPLLMCIKGEWYDIALFAKKHPGGVKVMSAYTMISNENICFIFFFQHFYCFFINILFKSHLYVLLNYLS